MVPTRSWPLEEYEEKRILNALLLQQRKPSFNPFQMSYQLRRLSLSNSLIRCTLCQRRFHSQGNLTNHIQLYHTNIK